MLNLCSIPYPIVFPLTIRTTQSKMIYPDTNFNIKLNVQDITIFCKVDCVTMYHEVNRMTNKLKSTVIWQNIDDKRIYDE